MRDMARRYIDLWLSFFRNSLTREMEYKANFISGIVVDALYYLVHLFFFEIIYRNVSSLGEFSREDVIIFLIITFIADAVYMFFFSGNLFSINHLLVTGDLDFYLLRPVNSQFIVSLRYVRPYAIITFVFLVVILVSQCVDYSGDISGYNVILFIISFLSGMSIWYSLNFTIACGCFWFKNFRMAGWLSNEILKFSRRPDSIYTGVVRFTLFSFIPMALIASVPTRFLIYDYNIKYLSLQISISIVLLYITRVTWEKGLIIYESASS